MSGHSKIQILIASEYVIFRQGLKFILKNEESFKIIGEATNRNEIFALLSKSKPAIILLNFRFESEAIISLCKNLVFKYPHIPILVFLDNNFDISLPDLIINGVRGIIWKENSNLEIIEAIKCVASGGAFFEDPENCRINCHLSKRICESKEQEPENDILTLREKEVLQLIARGLKYKDIASKLNISSRTVESHKNNLLEKLQLKNRNELVRFAIENLSF